jgi:hypothetical protein
MINAIYVLQIKGYSKTNKKKKIWEDKILSIIFN